MICHYYQNESIIFIILFCFLSFFLKIRVGGPPSWPATVGFRTTVAIPVLHSPAAANVQNTAAHATEILSFSLLFYQNILSSFSIALYSHCRTC